jgi:hypothetical protein
MYCFNVKGVGERGRGMTTGWTYVRYVKTYGRKGTVIPNFIRNNTMNVQHALYYHELETFMVPSVSTNSFCACMDLWFV